MRKISLLFLVAFVMMGIQGWSAPVDAVAAQKVARAFMTSNAGHDKFTAASSAQLRLVHTENSGAKAGAAAYYVFNSDDGYIIIAGDDRAVGVLAYGDGAIDMADIPCGMRALLNQYKEEIDFLHDHPDLVVKKTMRNSLAPYLPDVVKPMLTCTWGQRSPYNQLCPVLNGKRCLTGCVATALSQIMHYYAYPVCAPSIDPYTTSTTQISLPELPSTVLNWKDMGDWYPESRSTSKEVATLMQYVGHAVKMNYGTDESLSCFESALVGAIRLGYSSSAEVMHYNGVEWKQKMIGELSAHRPILYGANDEISGEGHAFVIDGYSKGVDTNNNVEDYYFHINWGWNMKDNKNHYYRLHAFNVTFVDSEGNVVRYKYNLNPVMITGLQPDPKYTVSSQELSFGNVPASESVTQTIHVEGFVKDDLTLELSGATEAYSVDRTSITPLEAIDGVDVQVTFRPTSGGPYNANLTISGKKDNKKIVTLTGRSEGVLTVTPSSLSFGDIVIGTPAFKTFNVLGTNLVGNLTLAVTDSRGSFSVNRKTITQAQAAEGIEVKVFYTPLAAGEDDAMITIRDEYRTSKTVIVTGRAIGSISPSVTSLSFDGITVGKTVTKTFNVSGLHLTDNLTLQTSGYSGFTIDKNTITPAEAEAGTTVKVTYHPTAAGTHNGKITISGGGATAATVTLKGTAVTRTVSVNPTSLAFGNVVVNTKSTKTFKVTGVNLTGNLTLKANGTGYSVTPTTITPAQAANGVNVTVSFKPTSTGNQNGKVLITSGDVVVTPVTLSGTGVKPTITITPLLLTINAAPGERVTSTFTVKAPSLSGNLTLTLSSTSNYYRIDKTSITAAQAVAGEKVTVTYTPTKTGKTTASVVVSGGGADSQTLSIVGICKLSTAMSPQSTIGLSWLIDGLLNNDVEVLKNPDADVNGDGKVDINDVRALINLQLVEIVEAE